MRIGIDLMGGDHPPDLLFPAILQASQQLSSDISLLVLATSTIADQLSSFLSRSHSLPSSHVAFQVCEEVVRMEDDPLTAVRLKKKSSLVLGMHLLKEKAIDAFISAGNTGALIASAAITLSLLPDVAYPALLAALPTKKGFIAVLDAGGSVQNRADQLVRFAFLGAAYQRAMRGISIPKVGLLNIGVESHKGNAEIRQAHEILMQYCEEKQRKNENQELHFIGNVEARDVFNGHIDLLVTDGFSGNILLKTAEGAASFVLESLKSLFPGQERSINKELVAQFDYSTYPGAVICGVDGIVIKMHGNATDKVLLASIYSAIECVKKLRP